MKREKSYKMGESESRDKAEKVKLQGGKKNKQENDFEKAATFATKIVSFIRKL